MSATSTRAWSKALTEGKVAPSAGTRRAVAAAEEIDAEHAEAIRVERTAGARRRPATSPAPSGSRLNTSRPAEMPPSAATTGAPRAPASRYAMSTGLEAPAEMQVEAAGQRMHGVPPLIGGRQRRMDRLAGIGRSSTPRAAGLRLRQASRLLASAARGCRSPHPHRATGQPCGNSSVGGRDAAVELAPFRAGWARRLPRLQRAIPSAGLDERAQCRWPRPRSVKAGVGAACARRARMY